MSRLYLKAPTEQDKENVLEFREEFIEAGQRLAGTNCLDRIDNYEEWLNKTIKDKNPETCEEGKVPCYQFLTYRKEDDLLVGMIQVRHPINKELLKRGGNIGDCVRPSQQGKGYATEQIALALEVCKGLGLKRVLMTCDKENKASAKTIMKNNGKLENETIDPDRITQRYWINLD